MLSVICIFRFFIYENPNPVAEVENDFFWGHFAMFVCEWADFVKAKCLMNAEVALVLQRKYEQLQQLSEDPVSQISQ
jgi:hypothetical protein